MCNLASRHAQWPQPMGIHAHSSNSLPTIHTLCLYKVLHMQPQCTWIVTINGSTWILHRNIGTVVQWILLYWTFNKVLQFWHQTYFSVFLVTNSVRPWDGPSNTNNFATKKKKQPVFGYCSVWCWGILKPHKLERRETTMYLTRDRRQCVCANKSLYTSRYYLFYLKLGIVHNAQYA